MQQNSATIAAVFDKYGAGNMMKQLTIEGLRALVDAGAVDHVRMIASTEGLYLEINRAFTVTNRAKRPRYFKKADTCFSWIRELGITTINDIDLSRWEV